VNLHVTANNSVTWCSARVIEANSDVPDGTNYPIRATTQSPNYNPVSNAISVSELLTLAGINPAGINHAEIMRLNGNWSTLDSADLVAPSTRFEDGRKPIFWVNGSETQYLRPLRGPSDTNGDDQIVASNGSSLDMYVYSGPVLAVAATATPKRIAVKQSVTVTARVANPAAGDGVLTYTWNFQDGSTATGASVEHAYAVAGTWYPVVTVLGKGNDSGGASQPIPVTVGPVPTGHGSSSPAGTDPRKHAGAGGPAHSSGSAPKTAPAPTIKSHSVAGASVTAGSNPVAAQAGSAAPRTTGPSRPSVSTRPTSPAASDPAPPVAASPTSPKYGVTSPGHVSPQSRPGATVVRGRLIADLIPISAAQLAQADPAGKAEPARAPSARVGGGSVSPLAGVAGGCAIVLLLASGAGAEVRSRRRAFSPAPTA
jgi:hypothetical protein